MFNQNEDEDFCRIYAAQTNVSGLYFPDTIGEKYLFLDSIG